MQTGGRGRTTRMWAGSSSSRAPRSLRGGWGSKPPRPTTPRGGHVGGGSVGADAQDRARVLRPGVAADEVGGAADVRGAEVRERLVERPQPQHRTGRGVDAKHGRSGDGFASAVERDE